MRLRGVSRGDLGGWWKSRESRRWVFGDKFGFSDEADVDLLQLEPLSELVDFGRQSVCIPLEDAEDWLADWVCRLGDEPVGLPKL